MKNTPKQAKYYAMKYILDNNAFFDDKGKLIIYGEIDATLKKMDVTSEMIKKYTRLRRKNEKINSPTTKFKALRVSNSTITSPKLH